MKTPQVKAKIFAFILWSFVLSVVIFAQSGTTGSLSGLVTDATGAIISNATITLTNTATGAARNTTSDSEGRWKAAVLEVSIYKITFEATGFKRGNVENIGVEAAVPRTLDIKLEAGSTFAILRRGISLFLHRAVTMS